MTSPWPYRLSANAASYYDALSPERQQTVRDTLAIAGRDPWGWPQWDRDDPEGEDVRLIEIGALAVVYWVNRRHSRLGIIDIQWAE